MLNHTNRKLWPIAWAPEVSAKQIMVIEDDLSNQKLISLYLESAGHIVTAFESGLQALEEVLRRPGLYDVVVLDLKLSDMHGLEIIQRLRGNQATRHLRIVCASGLTSANDERKAFTAGADNYLLKPFNRQTLLAAV